MPARRRAPRLSSSERRAALVAAAVRVLQRRGLARTQVSDVVKEAGVSRGTFYLHFESKRHLLDGVVRDLLDRMMPSFPRLPALSSVGDLERTLRDMHLQAIEGAARERAVARLVLAGGVGAEPGAVRWIAAHEEAWRRLVARLLERAAARGLLRDDADPAFAADCIVGSVRRVVRSSVLGKSATDGPSLAAALARFHVRALARDAEA